MYAKDAVVVLLDSGELHSGLLAYFCTLWARAAPLEIISVVDNAQERVSASSDGLIEHGTRHSGSVL